MFRNQYDNDITVFSPQGRLHQVEYAMEAVKQGSACAGAKSGTHAVVAALMRTTSEMSSYQGKVFKTDDHMGIAIAGLTADARFLTKFMRTECLSHRFVYGGPLQTQRLVAQIADKSQRYGRRPYGVGLLVIGYDQTGPHLFETDPSGNFFDYHAQAIGARSQSAKTYLERNFETFPAASPEQLVRHVIEALRQTIGNGKDEEQVSADNLSVAIVGKDTKFKLLTADELRVYLEEGEAMDTGK